MRAAIVVALVLTFSPAATAAAPPTIAVSATVTSDAAPLAVAFAASGDAVSYHWDFGDGGVADGASVGHVYRAGAFTAHVTGTSAGGETATAAVRVLSFALTLKARTVVGFGQHLRFTGRLVPAGAGTPDRPSHGRRQAGGQGADGTERKLPHRGSGQATRNL